MCWLQARDEPNPVSLCACVSVCVRVSYLCGVRPLFFCMSYPIGLAPDTVGSSEGGNREGARLESERARLRCWAASCTHRTTYTHTHTTRRFSVSLVMLACVHLGIGHVYVCVCVCVCVWVCMAYLCLCIEVIFFAHVCMSLTTPSPTTLPTRCQVILILTTTHTTIHATILVATAAAAARCAPRGHSVVRGAALAQRRAARQVLVAAGRRRGRRLPAEGL